jgi:hypothetical protein
MSLTESSRDGRPEGDDIELPRRRHDNEARKSEDAELLFECDAPVGVAGGVRAPLSCIANVVCVPRVKERLRVGESGGVEMVRKFAGLEFLRPGTVSLYPSLVGASVSS